MPSVESAWSLRLFGEVEAVRGEERVGRFGSRKHAALLALLALRPGRGVARDVLMEALWPEVDPARGGNRLAVAISALRGVLEGEPGTRGTVLEVDHGLVALRAGVATDLERFERELGRARQSEGEARRAALVRALAAADGPLLPGYEEGWIPEARARIDAAWVAAAVEVADRLDAEGLDGAIDLLFRAVARAPERVDLEVRLLDGFVRTGRAGEALAQGRAWGVGWSRLTGGRRLPVAVLERLERLEREVRAAPELGAAAAAPVERPRAGGARLVAHVAAELAEAPTLEGVEVRGGGGRWRLGSPAVRPLLRGLAELAARDPSARAAVDALDPEADPAADLAAALLEETPPGAVVATALASAWIERHGAATLVDLGRFVVGGRPERVGWWPTRPGQAAPELGARPARLGRLPASATRFFGRQDELHAVLDALDGGARLLTLLGPGGVGKTRLALEAARLAVGLRRVEEAAFASLAEAGSADAAGLAVLECFGLRLDDRPVAERLAGALAGRPTLLVLDNAEPIAPLLGPLVGELLAGCPALALVVTSQRPLGLTAERRLPLAPLPVPKDSADLDELRRAPAVALFTDRARAGRPDFTLNPSNAPAVVRLCRLLGGSPLALELAAGRAASLSPQRLLARLEAGDAALESRDADRPARHRTLAAAIEGNLALVDEALRRTWAAASVFPADFSVDAAEAVTGEAVVGDQLAELCDASLLRVATVGDEPRYTMPEGLRAHALAGLAEAERGRLRDRWIDWLGSLGRRARSGGSGGFDPAWNAVLAREWPGYRAAAAVLPDRGLALLRPILPHVVWAGREREVLRQLAPLLDDPPHALAAARELLDLANRVGEPAVVDRCLATFAAHEHDPVVLLDSAAQRASMEGRSATAAASFLRLHDALPSTKRGLRAAARMNHVRCLDELGRGAEAEAARARLRAEVDGPAAAYVLSTLHVYHAIAALWAGEAGVARAAIAAGDALFPPGEAPAWWAAADISRAHADLLDGDTTAARARLVPLVERYRAEQNERLQAFAAQTLGFVDLAEGAAHAAARHAAATAEVFARLDLIPEWSRSLLLRARAAAALGRPEAEDAALREAARAHTRVDVVWSVGWLCASLGRRELARGDASLGRRLIASVPRQMGPRGGPVPAWDPLPAELDGQGAPTELRPAELVERWLEARGEAPVDAWGTAARPAAHGG